jgi:predicted MPP superfamily phosphohydrolase
MKILHLSDVHAQEAVESEIRRRVDELIKSCHRDNFSPDVLVISGDIANHGSGQEFTLAEQWLITPLKSHFKLSDYKIILCPGNHDVDRSRIDFSEEEALRKLESSAHAQSFLEKHAWSVPRLDSYKNFSSKYTPKNSLSAPAFDSQSSFFNTRIITIGGQRIGFASLNTAWRCSSDEDLGRLFLTQDQIDRALRNLPNVAAKVAILHHPLSWLHDTESPLPQTDLLREFDVVLSGHLHENTSLHLTTPDFKSIQFCAPAFHQGKIDHCGYNAYEFDFENCLLRANFRMYIRTRNAFDIDTHHAQGGRIEFPLRLPSSMNISRGLVVQRVVETNSGLEASIKRELSLLQGKEDPVFVTPLLREVRFKEGRRSIISKSVTFDEPQSFNCLITGGEECGKSILLRTLAAKSAHRANTGHSASLGIYLDFKDFESADYLQNLEFFVSSKVSEITGEQSISDIMLFCDHIERVGEGGIRIIRSICTKNGWLLIGSIGSGLMFDALAASSEFEDFRFYEVCPWGPSRIREFAKKIFEGTSVDVDQAFQFVTQSLQKCDLPQSPTIIALYMSVFPSVGSEISSLSFLRLLEKIELLRLGENESNSSDSLYNRRRSLQILAAECLHAKSDSIPLSDFKALVSKYFERSNLPFDQESFFTMLERSAIIRVNGEKIGFSFYIFLDYYLAQSFASNRLDPAFYSDSIKSCISVSEALALFAGLVRDNEKVILTMMDHIQKDYSPRSGVTLADLERFVKRLLSPPPEGGADNDSDKLLGERRDYEKLDDNNEKERASVIEERKARLECNGVAEESTSPMEDLSIRVGALEALYNSFRNLENLDGEMKVLLLDQILDFHIDLNLRLIEFFAGLSDDEDFKTISAYLLTLGGHDFLSSNIGNHSLISTIRNALAIVKSDFKELLLVTLLADLRAPKFEVDIASFLKKVDSAAAIEILFLRVRRILVEYEGDEFPQPYVSLYREIFEAKVRLYNSKTGKGVITDQFNRDIKGVIKEHKLARANHDWNKLSDS